MRLIARRRSRRQRWRTRAGAERHRHRPCLASALRSCRRLHAPDDRAARCRCSRARATSRGTAEYEDATHPHERNRASYFAENYVPLARRRRPRPDAGRRDRSCRACGCVRTGGHTHAPSDRRTSSPAAGRRCSPPISSRPRRTSTSPWIMGYDLYPMETLAFKRAFVREAIEPRISGILRARSPSGGRVHPRGRTAAGTSRRCCTPDARLSRRFEIQLHMSINDRHHRRQRSVRHGGAHRSRGAPRRDAVRRPVGAVRHRHAARQARRVPGAARRRAPAAADRAELPREHLRLQAARRRVHPVGERRREPEGGVQAARPRDPGSVLRSHEGARLDLLRPAASSRTSASRIRSARR